MITRDGLERTGLDDARQPRGRKRFLFRLSPGSPGIESKYARAVEEPRSRTLLIADYRESHPIVTQGLNRATVPEPGQLDHAHYRRHIGVGRNHARSHPAALAGFHRDHEMHRRAIQPRHADLPVLQTLACWGWRAACWAWPSGLVIQRAFPGICSRVISQLEPTTQWDFRHRRARHPASRSWRRCSSHVAAADGHPAHPPQPDPAP